MEERDADWKRAHLRVEGNGVERHRLEESALDRARGVEEGTDWKRAHLRVEGSGGQRHRLGDNALEGGSVVGERDADWERAHLRVEKNEWRRETPTGRERN